MKGFLQPYVRLESHRRRKRRKRRAAWNTLLTVSKPAATGGWPAHLDTIGFSCRQPFRV